MICGLNAGVQYAQLQRPQFECQLTAQVRVLVTLGTLLRPIMLHITTGTGGGSDGGGDSPTDTNVHTDTPVARSATAWREPRGC